MSNINKHGVKKKGTLTAIIAGTMLAVTGATLPASAFEGHTHTLNVAEFGFNSPISQQQNTMLLAKAKVGNSTTKSHPTTGGRNVRLKNAATAAEIANHAHQIYTRQKGN